MAKNARSKHWRKIKLERNSLYKCDEDELDLIDFAVQSRCAENEYWDNMAVKNIFEVIESLNDNYKNSIKLCKLADVKPAEAAKLLDCKTSDISNYLYRGKAAIKTALENMEFVTDDFEPAA